MKSYKRLIGLLSILVGLIALVTPFTPGAAWLIFIGLGLVGFHFTFWDKIKEYFKSFVLSKVLSKNR